MNTAASIVIPLKRQNDGWLEQCVRSAVVQTAHCEVIVVRSEETPASNIEVLNSLWRECSNLRVILEKKRDCFPSAINLGIRCASSDRIGLLLSDDWLEPDAAARCLLCAADIVCTGQTTYYEDGVTVNAAASKTLGLAEYRSLETLEARARYLEHFFLFRREAVVKAGGLDEGIGNYPGIDDYDFIWTLLEQGATVDIVEQRLYNYRDHDGERLTLADPVEAARNFEKILHKHNVFGQEAQKLLKDGATWFGRPIYKVLSGNVNRHNENVQQSITTNAR